MAFDPSSSWSFHTLRPQATQNERLAVLSVMPSGIRTVHRMCWFF
jgi:hypothetical protein